MATPLHALAIDIELGNIPYPVMRHVFYGPSKEEAEETYRDHIRCDAFLRAVVNGEPIDGVLYRWRPRWRKVQFSDEGSIGFEE